MEQVIISNYRKVVSSSDTCYFLGDFTIKGSQHRAHLEWLVDQLPGTKILILGNHDKFNPFTYVDVGFQSVHTALDIGEFVLVHDPALCNVDKSRKWLCGHIHNLFKMNRNGNVLNVGVDQWGFFPVTIEEVRKMFNKGQDEDATSTQ
jgi:calcineurin-like phosphoesterase family protein